MADDLAIRLRAVIEDRLTVARAADREWGEDIRNVWPEVSDASAAHIALNDPADALLAAERDLAVLGRHRQYVIPKAYLGAGSWSCNWCASDGPCQEIRDMATRYGLEVGG